MYEPQDPDFAEMVRASFGRQGAMSTFGVRIEEITPGAVTLRVDNRPELSQQDGFLHAGVVASALDSACGYAAYSLAPPDSRVLTSEYKINLLRPAAHGPFLARGEVIKPGRLLTVCRGEMYPLDRGPLIAIMTATIVLLTDEG